MPPGSALPANRQVARRMRLARTLVVAGFAFAAGLLGLRALRASSALVTLTVKGIPVQVPPGATLRTALEVAHETFTEIRHPWPAPGDLVDVRGRVIGSGRGRWPQVFVQARACRLDDPVCNQDAIRIARGADLTEPVREKATVIPYDFVVRGRGPVFALEHRGVPGVRRVQRGTLSGLVAGVQVAQASPLVVRRTSYAGTPKKVALTFDDGPNPTWTPKVLDILKEQRVKATFFVLGVCAKAHPALVLRAVQEGHEIGLHSYGHANMAHRGRSSVLSDLERNKKALPEAVRALPAWYRPPYGAFNTGLIRAVTDQGYSVALWSIDPRDWRKPGSTYIYRHILGHIHNGAVILLHDGGGNRAGTVAALDRLIPALREKGYQMVRLSELTGRAPAPPLLAQPTPRLLLSTQGRGLVVNELPAGVQLYVNGQWVELSTPPVEVNGQLVVPALPTLEKLGAEVSWQPEAKVLTFSSLRGAVRMGALDENIEVGGSPEKVRVPLIVLSDQAMVPMWLLCNAFHAKAAYDEQTRVLRLDSSLGPALPLAPAAGEAVLAP